MNKNIDVVLVTYNPNVSILLKCIDSLVEQVRKIWIIDNSFSRLDDLKLNYPNEIVELIQLNENKGIACAQNVGIINSLKEESQYILLSDQDTIYPKNYVEQMLTTFEASEVNVAAVAPLFKDVIGSNDNPGFIGLSRFSYPKIFPEEGIHQINQAIASGLILKSNYLDIIGLMDADLFIDSVDFEWCWRANAKGYKIYGNASISIEHRLGDGITMLGPKPIRLRAPVRQYYITRNTFHLALKSPYLNRWHRLQLLLKGVSYILIYPLVLKPRLTNLKMTLLGFYHGLIGKLGRFDG